MLSFEDSVRLVKIQERLRHSTYHELRKEGGGKSSEGAVSISFHLPPVVSSKRSPHWAVEAYSYLLCPDGRTGTWFGRTAAEALAKAEDAIEKWCFASEMEMFEQDMGIERDPEFDESQPPPHGEIPE